MSIESVCKFLSYTVRSNARLWRDIHIDRPASREQSIDDALMQTMSLVKCSKITDDGLKRFLERNPRLINMNVPGCTRLTFEGILKCFKNFKSRNILPGGIKKVRVVGERYDVQHIHFEVLKSLIGEDSYRQKSNVKNLRYYGQQYSLSCGDDDCAMDIELWPRCRFSWMVYDCLAESCQGKKVEPQSCMACRFCVSRCYRYGRCINDVKIMETFCLEPVCSDCWNQVKA
ncbi:hypothetical protein MKW98_014113 [Papaver atlanticum]|uniref:Uncharacterized protein n=1 Tax=Papaver atlanticum TaxID=357466 RepID=A0AAD4SKG7_9MAGN|nr:hypothetical protein MKW98_014113 [Papaver atlanticum]